MLTDVTPLFMNIVNVLKIQLIVNWKITQYPLSGWFFYLLHFFLEFFYSFWKPYISPTALSTIILNFCQYLQGKRVFF